MFLYTCQAPEIYRIICEKGEYFADIKKSPWSAANNRFEETYTWLKGELAKRVAKPDKATCPIWAYAYDFEYASSGCDGEEQVYLKLEVPDDEVAFIDGYKWGDVVCGGGVFPENATDEECERIQNATGEERDTNWRQVFDVENDPEAIFWSIKKSYVKEAVFFVCHFKEQEG